MLYEQDGALLQEFLAGNLLAHSVGEGKLGERIARLNCGGGIEISFDLGPCGKDGCFGGFGGVLLEAREGFLEFDSEAHVGGLGGECWS